MDMKKALKQAQRMQLEMQRAQEEIKHMEYEATAGGGMVKAKVSGEMELLSLEISPIVVDPDDIDMLQDLVLAAVNEALRGMADMSSARMDSVAGGMGIPGIPGLM